MIVLKNRGVLLLLFCVKRGNQGEDRKQGAGPRTNRAQGRAEGGGRVGKTGRAKKAWVVCVFVGLVLFVGGEERGQAKRMGRWGGVAARGGGGRGSENRGDGARAHVVVRAQKQRREGLFQANAHHNSDEQGSQSTPRNPSRPPTHHSSRAHAPSRTQKPHAKNGIGAHSGAGLYGDGGDESGWDRKRCEKTL